MIIRSYFYRWQGRLKRHGLAGLEDRSRRPLNVRREITGAEVMEEIRRIRRKNPTYSAKKIRPILLRLYEEREASSVSNIIKRHNLFFRADTRAFKRRSGSAMRAAAGRRRVKESLRASEPNKAVEFDMKHIRIPLCGRRYALVGIDVYTKQAVIYVSGTCTSQAGRAAYQKVVARFGRGAVYVNDNRGENQGGAERWLKGEG